MRPIVTHAAVPGLIAGVVLAGGCWLLAPTPLGMAVAVVIVIVFVVPVLSEPVDPHGTEPRHDVLLVAVMTVTVMAVTWSTAAATTILAIGLAVSGATQAAAVLLRCRSAAPPVVIFSGVLWLSWPLWLAAWLPEAGFVQTLVDCYPPLVLNAILDADASMTHLPLTYELMNLQQDVAIAMPGPWLLWAVCGAAGLLRLLKPLNRRQAASRVRRVPET